ncbi:YdaS family helix-turn-helix protein [Sphingomonas jinjuensis]|uniref:transcriptional regulator n=1 Tax=Sphingomonas jinjuensis TaxID=535907 RepID=UPI0016218468
MIALAVRKAGSQSKFGRLVGTPQSTVREWLPKGRVGDRSVLKVEAATGVSRHDLRPDLYPHESAARTGASDRLKIMSAMALPVRSPGLTPRVVERGGLRQPG